MYEFISKMFFKLIEKVIFDAKQGLSMCVSSSVLLEKLVRLLLMKLLESPNMTEERATGCKAEGRGYFIESNTFLVTA